jgi:PiT family inorganic phosphate transporter
VSILWTPNAPGMRRGAFGSVEGALEYFAQIPVAVWMGAVLALYMAWAIGANDVANAMGTSVGSGALTLRGAIVVAAIFEFGGALFAGGHVTDTVRKGILDSSAFADRPELLVYGMLAALASAGTWLLIASRAGWPVSTTHSIVGSIVGFGVAGLGPDAVSWGKVSEIVASWVTSPLLSGVLAFLIFNLTRRAILDHERPLERARVVGPFFFGWVFFILGLVTLFKGLKNLKLDFGLGEALAISLGLGLVGTALGFLLLRRVLPDPDAKDSGSRFTNVERLFAVLQIMTACAVAFAHGSNDVANSIGPLAALVNAATIGEVSGKAPVALWMLGLGGVGIVIGLATYGYRVMETVGKKITELTPSRGFAAELAAATTIVIASRAGIPVSTTHTLVGAVLGVGLARGIGALDLRVVGRIVVSWVVTLPTGAALAAFFFYFFKGLFAS